MACNASFLKHYHTPVIHFGTLHFKNEETLYYSAGPISRYSRFVMTLGQTCNKIHTWHFIDMNIQKASWTITSSSWRPFVVHLLLTVDAKNHTRFRGDCKTQNFFKELKNHT